VTHNRCITNIPNDSNAHKMKIFQPGIQFLAIIFTLLFTFSSCNGQPLKTEVKNGQNNPDGIQWMSFEEAVKRSDQVPKKLFIDVYTDWCGWCKKMDNTTFKEPEVVKFINEKFYPVKLNAETRDTIRFRDKEFKYIPDYKANELAISLLSGKMGYPSYVLMDEKYSLMSPAVQSYLTKENLMPILVYYGDNIFKEKTWEEFEKSKQ
jgi:thioredoxin-related protein